MARKQPIDKGDLTIISQAVQLASGTAVSWLCQQVIDYEADFLIIDTLARSIDGLNENDAVDMGTVVTAMYRLRDARGEAMTAIMPVVHTGWENQNRSRGSSRLPSDTDFVHLMEKGKDGVFTLTGKKMKEDQLPEDRSFTLDVRQVLPPSEGHGPVTSCVLRKATIAEAEAAAAAAQDDPDEQILKHLRAHPEGSNREDMKTALDRNANNLSNALSKLARAGKTRWEPTPRSNKKLWFAV
jgi:hypothetical protein